MSITSFHNSEPKLRARHRFISIFVLALSISYNDRSWSDDDMRVFVFRRKRIWRVGADTLAHRQNLPAAVCGAPDDRAGSSPSPHDKRWSSSAQFVSISRQWQTTCALDRENGTGPLFGFFSPKVTYSTGVSARVKMLQNIGIASTITC